MQASKETATLFWDRVKELQRFKQDGEVVKKGSTDGTNIVRIQKGKRGVFITAYCVMQQLLNANVTQWPSAVSEDGLEISIWLMDFSLGRNGAKRLFKFIFFDEVAASRFFETFTDSLSCLSKKGLTYWQLRGDTSSGASGDEDESTESTGTKDKNNENGAVDKQQEGGEKEEEDNLAHILEMEENWGESQSLFHHMYPSL